MKKTISFPLLALAICFGAALGSCDNPKTIAWSYYGCALDTLQKGDPYAAKVYLERCNSKVDGTLSSKADSLMKVIEEAIEEDKKQKSE